MSALRPQEGGAAGAARQAALHKLEEELPKADLLVCFGGMGPSSTPPGTPPLHGVPILGVKHGQRGLHGGAGADGALPAGPLAKGHFVTEERMMLDIRLFRGRSSSARTWP